MNAPEIALTLAIETKEESGLNRSMALALLENADILWLTEKTVR